MFFYMFDCKEISIFFLGEIEMGGWDTEKDMIVCCPELVAL